MKEDPTRKFMIAVEKATMLFNAFEIDAKEYLRRIAVATELREIEMYEWLKSLNKEDSGKDRKSA